MLFEVWEDVGLEDGVVEADVVPADDEVCFEEGVCEGVVVVFPEYEVFIRGGGVGDGDGDAELGLVVAYVAEAALGF